MTDESKGKLALIDFGLVASLEQEDMDSIVSAIVHLSNKDYAALVDDFIRLSILPPDCDRSKVSLPLPSPLPDSSAPPTLASDPCGARVERLRPSWRSRSCAGWRAVRAGCAGGLCCRAVLPGCAG